MSHDDFATEALPGLPERLPEGETLLWQGAPDWRALAWRALHIREIAIYFTIICGWRVLDLAWAGAGAAKIIQALAVLLVAAATASAILVLIARLAARSTVYTITSRRVVMRFGIVLPMTFNFPFAVITRADAQLRKGSGGGGNISIGLKPGEKISWLILWPHVRPWRLRAPEPCLREINDAARVAGILADALRAAAGQEAGAPDAVQAENGAQKPALASSGTAPAIQRDERPVRTGPDSIRQGGSRPSLATAAAAAEH
jgi:hypothetical protein